MLSFFMEDGWVGALHSFRVLGNAAWNAHLIGLKFTSTVPIPPTQIKSSYWQYERALEPPCFTQFPILEFVLYFPDKKIRPIKLTCKVSIASRTFLGA